MDENARRTLTAERRDAMAELVVRQGAARVTELAERFEVSPATVRRDLERLEERGRLERVHGGAVALRARKGRQQASSRTSQSEAERIGRAVADMIDDGETIFLGPGLLPLEVARSLEDGARVTVITNGLEIAHWLATHTGIRLIITGGQAEGPHLGLVGRLTRDAVSGLRADRVILELGGVSAVEGLTEDSLPQAEIAQMLMETGVTTVVVVPPERVGRVAAVPVAPLTSADVIVTGREAPSAYLWDLSEVGVEIVLA
ncbi:MAG: DeoR/GlpR family DNA-binding transcription regulator [Chloroflexota bacterium]